MRKVTNGAGADSTSSVVSYLASNNKLLLQTLYLIGPPEDPLSFWLTDYESPLAWPIWGTFTNATIKRGQVTSKIGLDADALDVTWSPKNYTVGNTVATANPYQLAQMGWFDNKPFRSWTVYMPTPGDANTFGASELFGGKIGKVSVSGGEIALNIDSFLAVVGEKVPTTVIENTNTLAGFKGATPPAGLTQIPQFNVIAGSTPNMIIGDAISPTAHQIFTTNALRGGFLVFNTGFGLTLAAGTTRMWGRIASNQQITIGLVNYNQIVLYDNLPWAPTPGTDTFFVSQAFPNDSTSPNFDGFSYVPQPGTAL